MCVWPETCRPEEEADGHQECGVLAVGLDAVMDGLDCSGRRFVSGLRDPIRNRGRHLGGDLFVPAAVGVAEMKREGRGGWPHF